MFANPIKNWCYQNVDTSANQLTGLHMLGVSALNVLFILQNDWTFLM